MKINTIALDQPTGPKASNAPLASHVALTHPSRGQDSPPSANEAAHTVLRQVALFEQNESIAQATPPDAAHALPDIVYKGVLGKVLDVMPLAPSTRTVLQQANALVSSTVAARALGALTGVGVPTPPGNPNPSGDAIQTAQNKPIEALN